MITNSTEEQKGFRGLRVYRLAYETSMEIFRMTRKFPHDEIYCLTKQIRCSSRSVVSNIAEGYRKSSYPKHFVSKLTDADSECSETTVWLDYAVDCGYIEKEERASLIDKYRSVGRMLDAMMKHPEKFKRFSSSDQPAGN
ncbi:MAG TPA: four helix bundle protein [Bacteroidia bacterium]|jgi:four helix bundle protein|nr:four helix bundle protein [Bacteroidia bacterium]